MLTKMEHILLFMVFADFWMVCFFSTKRTVRVVTQKQFVSSIAHFNTFSFEVNFWNFDFSISKLLHWHVTFFCTHCCPSSGTVTWAEVQNHDSQAHVWRHKNNAGVSTKEWCWARKQETTTQLCETRCCTSSDVQLEVGRRNANKRFPIIFPTQPSLPPKS